MSDQKNDINQNVPQQHQPKANIEQTPPPSEGTIISREMHVDGLPTPPPTDGMTCTFADSPLEKVIDIHYENTKNEKV